MIFTLTENVFDILLKYVVSNNINQDAYRCNLVELKMEDKQYYEITICFNENKKQVAICEINCEGFAIKETDYGKYLELLLKSAKQEQNKSILYDFYKKKIEPVTTCCSLNQ
jgi:hypothetical protein